MTTATIEVGNRVRSFDFEDRGLTGERACYVEGTVVEIGNFPEFPDCPRYKIQVERHVFGGEELAEHEDFVFPPVNGTPRLFSRSNVCDGVVLID
jgi:hypothetical protein